MFDVLICFCLPNETKLYIKKKRVKMVFYSSLQGRREETIICDCIGTVLQILYTMCKIVLKSCRDAATYPAPRPEHRICWNTEV